MKKEKAGEHNPGKRTETVSDIGETKMRLSPDESQKLLNELQVHQIELEMQNEELRRTENELLNLRDRYVQMYDFAPIGYVVTKEKDLISEVNLPFAGLIGSERSSFMERPFSAFVAAEDQDAYYLFRKKLLRSGKRCSIELRLNKVDGAMFWALIESVAVAEQDGETVLITVSDISERKQEEEKFRSVTESVNDAIIMLDHEGKISLWNQGSEQTFGYKADEVMGRNLHELLTPERFRPGFYKAFPIFCKTGEGKAIDNTLELSALHKDGHEFPIELSLSALFRHGRWEAVGIVRDITQRKQVEQNLLAAKEDVTRKNRIAEIFLANTGDEIYGKVLQVILQVLDSGYGTFGYLNDAGDLVVHTISHDSSGRGMVIPQKLWQKSAWSRVIREKRGGYENELSMSPADERITLFRHIILPVVYQQSVIGLLQVANKECDYDEKDIQLLQRITDDVASFFGIRLQREREHKARIHSQELLRLSLQGTIAAISRLVEARDPYTAGHQHRVAELAAAIATELGLDAEQIEGIRLGASIHDIGKIKLPAEILSKPSKLSNVEFNLIQTHSAVGYDILKDIDFPWPIADIAHQHHEHIDGSGYPQGLKGERICIGAKIVAVADVVEAMSSHRPYRPSLGMDAALAQIDQHKGILYDTRAAEACLQIFAEKRFSFSVENNRQHAAARP